MGMAFCQFVCIFCVSVLVHFYYSDSKVGKYVAGPHNVLGTTHIQRPLTLWLVPTTSKDVVCVWSPGRQRTV